MTLVRRSGGAVAVPAEKLPPLTDDLVRDTVARAAEAGIVGGSIHDALVGASVRDAGGRLLTRDRRAAPAYERVGVDYELIG